MPHNHAHGWVWSQCTNTVVCTGIHIYMYINVAFYVRSERSLYYTKFNELLRSRAKDIIMQCICRAFLNVLATCKKVLRGMTMLP